MKHLKRTRIKRKGRSNKRRTYRRKTYKKPYQRHLKGGWGVVMGNANPYITPQKKEIIIGGWGPAASI